MRTSTWMRWRPPIRSTIWSCRKRSSLTCSGCGRSPISSRNSVPLMGALDLADRLLHRAGERAALVAEQLAFQQILRDRAAVDGDEWLLGARSKIVQRLRQRLLAGAALTQQQDRHIGRGELLDVAADLQHRLIGGDDPLDRRTCRHRGQPAVLLLQPMQVADRARRSCAAPRSRPASRRNRRRRGQPPSARSCARHCR